MIIFSLATQICCNPLTLWTNYFYFYNNNAKLIYLSCILIIKDQNGSQNSSQNKRDTIIICLKRIFTLPFKSHAFNNSQLSPFCKCISHTESPEPRSFLRNFPHWVRHTATSAQGVKCSAALSQLLWYTPDRLYVQGCSQKLVPSTSSLQSCHLPVSSSIKPAWQQASMTIVSENSVHGKSNITSWRETIQTTKC